MNIIEEIYYNNVEINNTGNTYMKLLNLICRHESDLEKTFSESQKEIFEKFKDCESELNGDYNRDTFVQGFILGARIIIEVMQGDAKVLVQDNG